MDSAIAITGMSCRFAGCANPAQFWNAIMSKRNMLTVPLADSELPLGQKNVFDRPYPSRLGQLGDLYSCVPSMQNFPRQVNAGENQDLYFATQLAFDALADASMKPHQRDILRGTVRVGYSPPFNAATVNWLQHTIFIDQTMEIVRRFLPRAPEESLDIVKSRLAESLPTPNAASFLLGSGYRFASWIARECSFGGVAAVIDSGNISGAVSILDAVNDLRSGHADIALAGALTPPLNRAYLEGVSGEITFSTKTEYQPFSKDSDGTIPGEGGAFFVLKRREDALRDRDRIYALVKTIEIGHCPEDDPSAIIANATTNRGIDPKTIGLIEADGSGIKSMQDREIAALASIAGAHEPGGALAGIGSVKGNIGHTLRSAVAASVAKAALALRYKVLPPQIAPESPMDELNNLSSSIYLLTEARPWITGDSASPRRALVLGANFDPCNPIGVASRSGRSAAIVLEEEPEVRG